MSTLKVLDATVRLSNENDESREYKITAHVSINNDREVTGINSGSVYPLEDGEQLCSFHKHGEDGLTYNMRTKDIEVQKLLIDEIAAFVTKVEAGDYLA